MSNNNSNTGDINKLPVPHNPHKITRRIGSTTYEVSVHFSETSCESMDDKIMRLISSGQEK